METQPDWTVADVKAAIEAREGMLCTRVCSGRLAALGSAPPARMTASLSLL